MPERPIIGVTFARLDYVEALRAAGADVRELSPGTHPLPHALNGLDGVLLTGGADVDPALYGAPITHPSVEVSAERDAYELPLAREALARQLPLLAICRGVQVLNVAAGGTLIQDIPSERSSPLEHTIVTPKDALAHVVVVTSGTQLEASLKDQIDDGRLRVNSRHHQAVDRVAPGFVVSAVATDGIVEAIERPGAACCLGVQWHPENFWRTGEFASLFEHLVAAARK